MANKTAPKKAKKEPVELRPMAGFKRYNFLPTGAVVNVATGKKLACRIETSDGKAYQLTNDKGARQTVTRKAVKNLYAPAPAVVPEAPAQAGETVSTDTAAVLGPKDPAVAKAPRVGQKLDYEKAQLIRQRVAKGEKRGALAKEYGVDGWTIQSIVIGYTYKLHEGDVNPIPAHMMREFLKSNLPEAWKKDPNLIPVPKD